MIEFYYKIYLKNGKYSVNKIIKNKDSDILNDYFIISKKKLNNLITKLNPNQYEIIKQEKDEIYEKLLEGNLKYP